MANNLRMLRDGRGWTQGEAAAAFGTTRNQYAKLEGGSRRLSDKWIRLASDAYGVDPGEVVTDRVGAPPAVVPVVGYVGAGTEMHFYAEGQGPLDEAPAPDGATPSTVAAEIRGDSLGAIFVNWRVFYDDCREAVTGDLLGRLCVVGLADGRVLIKKVLRGRSEGRFDLHGQFSEPVLDAEVLWAAKVTNLTPP